MSHSVSGTAHGSGTKGGESRRVWGVVSSDHGGTTPAASGRIFISYRREDTANRAAPLFDRLSDHFGKGQVFKDVESIQLGADFVKVITAAVRSCDVLLALIGDRWLTITDKEGRRRLDNPEDVVRLEIQEALRGNVRVIPILVEGVQMPQVDELPDSLAMLVDRNALRLSRARFDSDVERLVKELALVLQEKAKFYVDTLLDHSEVRDADLPLMIEGKYLGYVGVAVRVILEDSYQQYYVQNPEVKFLSDGGTWSATNILPGHGIMYVHFVSLDRAGKNFFDQMVERRAFGAFREMPAGSRFLQSVRIYRMTER
jgi:TIR domain